MTPLDGIDRLLIDGNNLLHRISGSVDPGAIRLLLARLSGAIPATLPTIVMLDGHAASGTDRHQRIRRGLEIHHAGSLSADDALLNLVKDTSPRDRTGVILVTDDRALTDKTRHLGAHTQRLDWLQQILDGKPAGANASIGRKGVPPPTPTTSDDDRQPWQPGRGATTKKGNPRRTRRARR
jgi:rRNA-processing protein FCF1